MYYHVRITQKTSRTSDETKVDLSEEELTERFLKLYEHGLPIIINGKTIPLEDIERIRISKSEEPSEHFIRQLKAEDRASPIASFVGPSYEWLAADRAADVTDELILGPPGYRRGEKMEQEETLEQQTKSTKKVFVVHGHDHELKNDAEVFLREIGLEPVVLHREPDQGLTVIEKFERNADVQFALVLLTPDDVGFAVTESEKPEKERVTGFRARQNVIFELGYFVGKLGRSKVFYIFKEGVELPSDLTGLIYKKVKESVEEVGYALIKEFKTAGLNPHIE